MLANKDRGTSVGFTGSGDLSGTGKVDPSTLSLLQPNVGFINTDENGLIKCLKLNVAILTEIALERHKEIERLNKIIEAFKIVNIKGHEVYISELEQQNKELMNKKWKRNYCNREIKFRAWDNGTMYPMAMVGEPANPSVWTSANWRECTENVILMQYTGLKDKNDKEIYEGDIVRTGNSESATLSLIVFKHQAFLLKYLPIEKKGSEQIYDYMENYEYFKIIGNIYENPELL